MPLISIALSSEDRISKFSYRDSSPLESSALSTLILVIRVAPQCLTRRTSFDLEQYIELDGFKLIQNASRLPCQLTQFANTRSRVPREGKRQTQKCLMKFSYLSRQIHFTFYRGAFLPLRQHLFAFSSIVEQNRRSPVFPAQIRQSSRILVAANAIQTTVNEA